ncbi:mitochondrial import inner membrane translocase subunit Tim10B-like isoform X3 [Condylostylus longicornis]|nr:mitochondrial import inner membrane translocase subunit Tim10B-like isoform X3 [Condylostylus longicornis]
MKDFLQLYNKITELCFSHCADNFYSRTISVDETLCIDKCLQKFTRVNQRVMNVYVDVQTEITQRRVQELESLTREQQSKISAVLGPNENQIDNKESVSNEITPNKINTVGSNLDSENSNPLHSAH